MSRIGKAPISIPGNVEVKVDGNLVKVKGPKGELEQKIADGFEVKIENGTLEVKRPSDEKEAKSKHG